MNKIEIETKISIDTGIDKKIVTQIVNNFLKEISDSLSNNDPVKLVNFGTFSITHRKEREGNNPANGEKIKIKARNCPVFKPGKALKNAVNN